jgi:hypothetical protein
MDRSFTYEQILAFQQAASNGHIVNMDCIAQKRREVLDQESLRRFVTGEPPPDVVDERPRS